MRPQAIASWPTTERASAARTSPDQCGLQDATLVIHNNADAIVPIEGAGQRTHTFLRA